MLLCRSQKADPDQDAINVPPGVVTYVGVQMLNITRLPSPYQDRCIDKWPDNDIGKWAVALNHDTYTTQICLKICLQKHTLEMCNCWTPTAPWPPFVDDPQCSERRNRGKWPSTSRSTAPKRLDASLPGASCLACVAIKSSSRREQDCFRCTAYRHARVCF